MHPKVCRCCAETMNGMVSSNPNVCLNCDQMSFVAEALGLETYAEVDSMVPVERGLSSLPLIHIMLKAA